MNNKKSSKTCLNCGNVKRASQKGKISMSLRRPPRLDGKVAKVGIKPIRKKSKKK